MTAMPADLTCSVQSAGDAGKLHPKGNSRRHFGQNTVSETETETAFCRRVLKATTDVKTWNDATNSGK